MHTLLSLNDFDTFFNWKFLQFLQCKFVDNYQKSLTFVFNEHEKRKQTCNSLKLWYDIPCERQNGDQKVL